ncbi:MAG: SO2930 family diheme c-type cytochrome [Candidatus Hydrogenedentota bacterium]
MRFLAIVFVLFASVMSHAADFDIHWDGRFEKQLSAYNLFADPVTQMPNEGLLGYEIVSPLFSDYALKDRFIYLSDGATMRYDEWEAFELPVGSAMVTTFSYPKDFREPDKNIRLIETRLMIHTEMGWKGAAYVWNEEQTDATLKVAGKQIPLEWTHYDGTRRSTKYLVPNMNECRFCHRATGTVGPLGVKARQLNRFVETGNGRGNQLQHWKAIGILDGLSEPDDVPRMAAWSDASGELDARAAAYLDINCAHCHNPKGHANYTRLDLSYTQQDSSYKGVFHRPTSAGNSSRGLFYAIVPGDAEASFLLHRIRSTEPQTRMPQTGRTVTHDEGVELIREWIESLVVDE